jgi:lipopolysaccharide/colanic/teichoic acid biosynthesis glycosyltransferase
MVPDADMVLEEILERDPVARSEYDRYWKLHNDPRVTRIGRLIRKTSLDELPQLINVVRGEMALVGPRPVVTSELPRYGDHVDELLSVRPGMTGLWQVSGRNDLSYSERVRLDVSYVRTSCVRGDLGIIAKTAVQIALPFRNGAR